MTSNSYDEVNLFCWLSCEVKFTYMGISLKWTAMDSLSLIFIFIESYFRSYSWVRVGQEKRVCAPSYLLTTLLGIPVVLVPQVSQHHTVSTSAHCFIKSN